MLVRRLGLAVFAAALSAGTALAGPAVTATWEGFSNGSVNATLTNVDPARNINVAAGAFNIGLTGADMVKATVQAFCVDIFHYLSLPATFQTGLMSDSFTADKVSKVNALLTHASTAITSAATSAGMQFAVWEVINEAAGPYDINGGNFKVTNTDGDALTAAAGFLAHLQDGTWKADAAYVVSDITATDNQTLVYLTAVPEPASLSVLGLGLAGMAFYRRRRAA